MSFYIDLSELVKNPITTGIQRIEGEICRHLTPDSVIPVRLHAGAYIALPADLTRVIGTWFQNPSERGVSEVRRTGAVENGTEVNISKNDIVLVPEVIIEPQRLDYFWELTDDEFSRYRFIVYDLLPLTHPEYFWSHWLLEINRYFRILRRATYCAFISETTREAYYRRLKRAEIQRDIILPLGSDSLGPRANRPLARRGLAFTVLGTVEPRKNHELILEAFEPLLRQIGGLSLTFIGKKGWVNPAFVQKLDSMARDPSSGFHWYSECGDDVIRDRIELSRATVYVSAVEGYGLPPVESLWVGTPVIASTTVPSLQGLGSSGIHFVAPLTARNLRAAVLAFLDDDYANQKIEEAMRVNLPTWRSFTESVLDWCVPRCAVEKDISEHTCSPPQI